MANVFGHFWVLRGYVHSQSWHEFEAAAKEHYGHAKYFGIPVATTRSADCHDDAVHSF
jgi:hypothetical protein